MGPRPTARATLSSSCGATEVGYENRDRLTVTSLLHDVGKLVLLHAYPGYPSQVHRGARTVGLGPTELRSVMYDLPYPTGTRTRQIDPCPLSTREVEVLKRLAEGKVYKQIAHELALSTSTVRTHLHNIYGKLGAVDRAQAVLMATERGWL